MMTTLSLSVKELVNRFDKFENNIETKVNRMQSEMVILRNKVEFIELNHNKQTILSSSRQPINTMEPYTLKSDRDSSKMPDLSKNIYQPTTTSLAAVESAVVA